MMLGGADDSVFHFRTLRVETPAFCATFGLDETIQGGQVPQFLLCKFCKVSLTSDMEPLDNDYDCLHVDCSSAFRVEYPIHPNDGWFILPPGLANRRW